VKPKIERLAILAILAALAAPAAARAASAPAPPLSTVVFGQIYARHAGTCALKPTGSGALTITCAAGQAERVNYRLAKVAGATARVIFTDASGVVSVSTRSGRHSRSAIVRVGEGVTVISRATAYTA
jgi:hypothetical protein